MPQCVTSWGGQADFDEPWGASYLPMNVSFSTPTTTNWGTWRS